MVKKNLSNKENKKKVSKSKKLSNIEINELNRILFSEPIKYYLVNNRISKLNLQLIDKTTFVKETCKTLNLKDTEIKTIFHWAYLYDTRSIEFYRYINVINILPKLKEYISKSTNVLNVFTHASVVDEVLTTLKSSKKVNFELKVLRQDVSTFIEADVEIIKQKQKVSYLKVVCSYLENTLKQINNRGFQIKNAIDWKRFTEGGM